LEGLVLPVDLLIIKAIVVWWLMPLAQALLWMRM
jgi:hypothetical protein